MGREMSVSDSVVIEAAPEVLYAQVSDPRQMRRWSPENTGAKAPDRPLVVGDRFTGSNKRGPMKWVTECTVTTAEPGKRFAFDVRVIGLRNPFLRAQIASWSYDFEPVAEGTKVTETWSDGRVHWPDWSTALFDPIATKRRSFADFQRGNIRRTLSRLKADFEAAK